MANGSTSSHFRSRHNRRRAKLSTNAMMPRVHLIWGAIRRAPFHYRMQAMKLKNMHTIDMPCKYTGSAFSRTTGPSLRHAGLNLPQITWHLRTICLFILPWPCFQKNRRVRSQEAPVSNPSSIASNMIAASVKVCQLLCFR